MAILDEADYRILDILQKDGRITFSDLADQVNLSRSAVRERIKNMQDSGIIRGFTAIIDAKAYEKFASVYMDIEAEPMKINDVAKELMKLNEMSPSTPALPGCMCMHTSTALTRCQNIWKKIYIR